MIGEVVYELRATNSARLPFINGRLMHAAFFKILHRVSPELENFVHDQTNIKPFTVSFLNPVADLDSYESRWNVRVGDKFNWRVTALNADIMNAALAVEIGDDIQVGSLNLVVADIKPEFTSAENFIMSVKNTAPATEIAFKFLTPVSFRIDNYDAPYPRAELIFASLADKWTQNHMPATVDKKIIREMAAQIRLTEWEGRSRKFYFAHDRGTLAFWGKFNFNIEALDLNSRKVLMLLAKFAEYAGVGRLNGQGFGQTRVDFQ